MLAKVFEPRYFVPGMLVQPKLNGIRLMVQDDTLISRDGVVFSVKRFSRLRQQLSELKLPKGTILDGELYLHGLSLQQINKRASVNSVDVRDGEDELEYHIFDYVSRASMCNRIVALSNVFRKQSLPNVKLVSTYMIKTISSLNNWHQSFKRQGFEGTMLRHPHKGYAIVGEHRRKDNRVDWLLKKKDWLDLDAVIVRVLPGKEDKRFADTMGSFDLEWQGKRFNAGSGPTDIERDFYWTNRNNMVGTVVKVQYETLSDEGVPLKPVIIQVNYT